MNQTKEETRSLFRPIRPTSVATQGNHPLLALPTLYYEGPTKKQWSSIPEGQALTMDLSRAQELNTLINGDVMTPPAPEAVLRNMLIDTTPSATGFPVVRIGNRLYVRGWVTRRLVHEEGNRFSAQLADSDRVFDTVNLFRTPLDHTRVKKTISAKTPPLGASPIEVARHYSPKNVFVDDGPARTQIQIPVDAVAPNYEFVPEAKTVQFKVGVDLTKLDEHAYQSWVPTPEERTTTVPNVSNGKPVFVP